MKRRADISCTDTKNGGLYLSMIRDLYTNSIVSYKAAIQQTFHLVPDVILPVMQK